MSLMRPARFTQGDVRILMERTTIELMARLADLESAPSTYEVATNLALSLLHTLDELADESVTHQALIDLSTGLFDGLNAFNRPELPSRDIVGDPLVQH
jgi:hypothetical protein